jgi:hypothetical protein
MLSQDTVRQQDGHACLNHVQKMFFTVRDATQNLVAEVLST